MTCTNSYARLRTLCNALQPNFIASAAFRTSSAATAVAASDASDAPLVPRQKVQLSWLMSPEHANIRGFVHGGNLIRFIEEAGFVAATRQVAYGGSGKEGGLGKLGALARIEHLDFLAPVEVGDVVDVEGGVDFVSPHSCRVSLKLTSAHVVQPGARDRGKKLTNNATIWYVPLHVDSDGKASVVPMPNVDLSDIDAADLQAAQKEYLTLKTERQKQAAVDRILDASCTDVDLLLSKARCKNAVPGTVSWTKSSNSTLVSHHDYDLAGNVSGGAFLKLADEVAGLAASKHTMGGSPTTACMDAVNFRKVVPKGSFVRLESRVVFAAERSCEVLVRGDAVHIYAPGGPVAIPRAMEARFTFVAYDPDGRLKKMPPLIPETDEERKEFEEGRLRYEMRRKQRSP